MKKVSLKFRKIVPVLSLGLILVFGAPDVLAMSKEFGRILNPGTGSPAGGANVEVRIAGTQTKAPIFSDNTGNTSKQNPFKADNSGYYEFYVMNGEYDVVISHKRNFTYTRSNVVVFDPSEPQVVTATPSKPALTLEGIGPGICIPTVEMVQRIVDMYPLDRHVDFMRPLGPGYGPTNNPHWGWDLFRAEVGFNWHYNGTSGRLDRCIVNSGLAEAIPDAIPSFPEYRREDENAPVAEYGYNTADFGNFDIVGFSLRGGFRVDYHGGGILDILGGGVWLDPGAGTAINVQMDVEGSPPLTGDVVVLSTTTNNAVAKTAIPHAKAPFVVTQVNGAKAYIAVQGLAEVNVSGPVAVGDALVSSAEPGYAMASVVFKDTQTLGYALSDNPGGFGIVTARVGLVREGTFAPPTTTSTTSSTTSTSTTSTTTTTFASTTTTTIPSGAEFTTEVDPLDEFIGGIGPNATNITVRVTRDPGATAGTERILVRLVDVGDGIDSDTVTSSCLAPGDSEEFILTFTPDTVTDPVTLYGTMAGTGPGNGKKGCDADSTGSTFDEGSKPFTNLGAGGNTTTSTTSTTPTSTTSTTSTTGASTTTTLPSILHDVAVSIVSPPDGTFWQQGSKEVVEIRVDNKSLTETDTVTVTLSDGLQGDDTLTFKNIPPGGFLQDSITKYTVPSNSTYTLSATGEIKNFQDEDLSDNTYSITINP